MDVYTQAELDSALKKGLYPRLRGSGKFEVAGDNVVIARDHCQVTACKNSLVWAVDYCQVIAHDNSTVEAHNHCSVTAYGDSCVQAGGYTQITAYDRSQVIVYDDGTVSAYRVEAYNQSQVSIHDRNVACRVTKYSIIILGKDHADANITVNNTIA